MDRFARLRAFSPASYPDLFNWCPVWILRAGRMAWIQAGFEGFGGIGTRTGTRRPGPHVVIPAPHIVIPGLVPGIHAAARRKQRRGMPGTSPGMTEGGVRAWRRSLPRACRRGAVRTWRREAGRRRRARQNPRRSPVRPRPMAKPDSRGFIPGIHAAARRQRWRQMPGTSPDMTEGALRYDGRNVIGLPRQPIL